MPIVEGSMPKALPGGDMDGDETAARVPSMRRKRKRGSSATAAAAFQPSVSAPASPANAANCSSMAFGK